MISKEKFVACIDSIKKVFEYEDDINAIYRKYLLDGTVVSGFRVVDMLVDVLDNMFSSNEEETCDNIGYFVWETDFGEKIVNAPNDDPWVITEDGIDISDNFTSAEKLYDYLTSKL